MAILYALILGLVQGVCEFLPISSSGHLLLLEHIFGITDGSLFFNVLLHFATLVAVIIVFWKDIVWLIRHPLSQETLSVVVATIPTVIIALVVEHFVDEYAMVAFLGFGFLISAIVITLTCILQKRRKTIQPLGYKNALIIGLAQGVAVFPGISRSASTICTSLMLGVEREQSAKFSFIISLPVILGGMVFEVADGVKSGFGNVNAFACIVGFIAAFLVAIATIKLMMKVVKKGKWWGFALYLFILSAVVILNQYVFMWF